MYKSSVNPSTSMVVDNPCQVYTPHNVVGKKNKLKSFFYYSMMPVDES